ncbi:MAG: hypothetical protein IJE55_00215 [Clostridia bacterium]|nr:hypothetical protein [Clostridia bacterium]
MSRPNKDTRAKRAFKKAIKYFLLMIVWAFLINMAVNLIEFLGVNTYGETGFIISVGILLFIFAFIFAYFKDYLDEINEKLDRIEQKMNDK